MSSNQKAVSKIPVVQSSQPESKPQVLMDRFKVLADLGRGSQGIVFKVEDLKDGNKV
jgi:hypothetical protein